MVTVQVVAFSGDTGDHIRAIRSAVFSAEQGVTAAVDFDGQDASAIQVLATVGDKPAGTGRMLTDGHIGRIAVLPQYRRTGLGKSIVQALLSEARTRGYRRVFLGAQTHAIGFYSNLGFKEYGEEYMEAGIEHIAMELLFEP